MIIKHEKKKLFLLMGIAYILYLVVIVNSVPLHTSTDELGTILGAAMLAGRNWNGVIDSSGYYGFGYYSLFFWLFKLTSSPFIIYRVVIVTTTFLRVLVIPIAYYIAKKYLGIKSEKLLYGSAFLMPFLYSTSAGIISNEYMLELLVWIIILLACKVVQRGDNVRKRCFYFFLLILCCFYSLLIHTRALTILIALAVTAVFWGMIKKRVKFSVILSAGVLACYFISQKIISIYQLQAYGLPKEQIRNASVEISAKIGLFDLKIWSVWLHMILGIVNTEIITTGGLFLISVVTFAFYLYHSLKKLVKVNIYCNMIYSFSILCIGATIAALMVSGWFDGMTELWGTQNAGNNYAFKGLTLIRYWNIYVPQFVLCSISIIKYFDMKKIIKITVVIFVSMQLLFMNFIIPLVKDNSNAAGPFYGLVGYHFGDEINNNVYYLALILTTIILFLLFIIVYSKYKKAMIIFIVFLCSIQINKSLSYDNKVKESMSSKIMASYEKKCELEQSNIYIDNIFIQDITKNTDENWKLYSIAQFYFNEYTLEKNLPDTLGSNDVIITTGKNKGIEDKYQNIFCYILDDNEVWYTYLNLMERSSL